MGADNAEKQGHSAFPSLLPFRHLASTKGCYVTAIYTRAPFSLSPSLSCRQHHMQTKWNCCSALLQVPPNNPTPLHLCFASSFLSSDQPLSLSFFQLNESVCLLHCFCFFKNTRLNAPAMQVLFWKENRAACHAFGGQMAGERNVTSRRVTTQLYSCPSSLEAVTEKLKCDRNIEER